MNDKKNNNIGCTVENCKHHCKDADCCSLKSIEVGACNCTPNSSDGTCCRSFETKTY